MMIPDGFCMLERNVFPRIAENGRLFGFAFNGQWFDTGAPERYFRAARGWKGIRT